MTRPSVIAHEGDWGEAVYQPRLSTGESLWQGRGWAQEGEVPVTFRTARLAFRAAKSQERKRAADLTRTQA